MMVTDCVLAAQTDVKDLFKPDFLFQSGNNISAYLPLLLCRFSCAATFKTGLYEAYFIPLTVNFNDYWLFLQERIQPGGG
jgi:hypothetical protein